MKEVSYIMIWFCAGFEIWEEGEWGVIVAVDYWLIDGCRLFGVFATRGSMTWLADVFGLCDEDRWFYGYRWLKLNFKESHGSVTWRVVMESWNWIWENDADRLFFWREKVKMKMKINKGMEFIFSRVQVLNIDHLFSFLFFQEFFFFFSFVKWIWIDNRFNNFLFFFLLSNENKRIFL